MTPEERFAAHEQWLLDHDRGIAEIRHIQQEQAEIQRKQSAVMLELTQRVVDLLDRRNGGDEEAKE